MEMDLHERLKAAKIVNAGGGGEPPVFIEKEINQNGTYIALDDEVDGYSKVIANVPNTYVAGDEGKVVDNGALVAQTTHAEITENGIYDITTNNSVSINVPSRVSDLIDLIEHDITSIDIPDGATKIGDSTFYNCEGLVNVTIPSTVTSIGSYAFYNCYNLSSITIPDSVTSIGKYAFYYCSHMSYIKFESTTPPTVGNINAWGGLSTSTKILVPTGTLETYKSANNYPNPSAYTYEEY